MKHGVVEVVAYQETLLIMVVFGLAILAMIWLGFRKWLQSKERMHQLTAEQRTETAAQYAALIERVEARLNALEHISDGAKAPAQMEESRSKPRIGQ